MTLHSPMVAFRTFVALAVVLVPTTLAKEIHVSPSGSDHQRGTAKAPVRTLEAARKLAQAYAGRRRVTITLADGIYYLDQPLVFTSEDSGKSGAPVIYRAEHEGQAILSGGVRLDGLSWQPSGEPGIYQTPVPDDLQTEEIFVNGERQILARYPNFDPTAKYFDGFAADCLSRARVARWADPTGGYFHAMHPSFWGDFTWRITGKDANGEATLEGGWQNNRGAAAHEEVRFVENLFEELDAPGEWFLDTKTHTLYFYPPAGLDLTSAVVETTRLRSLVEFRGDDVHPVKWITLRGFVFRQAARTVMDNREPLLRSDWTIYRGGAVCFDGAEDCSLEDSFIDQVGGNAVFVNNYNRRITIRGTHIARAGANGICFVGDPKAARSPLFNYDQVQELDQIDRTPGPQTNNYPADCLVEDCLIQQTGRVEKQTAGVEIDLAQDITIRHCSIYDLPRAGINIGDGCWGGHVIEFCDIFDTVKETGDHGSFNSWGRDRFWRPNIDEVNAWIEQAPDLPLLDVVKPIQLLNNRWRCDQGWDIDLDDGSSNYVIRDNLCLQGGIKTREGYGRIVENNILVDGGYDPHVWYSNSGDIFRRNIVWTAYRPANMPPPPWGAAMDDNLVQAFGATTSLPAIELQSQSGRDPNSIVADARFIDPTNGDYRVQDDSPALALGFVNFPMDRFGVQKPALRTIARTPTLPQPGTPAPVGTTRAAAPLTWLGARVRNITDEGERSAYGLPGVTGVLVVDLPTGSALAQAGLEKDDVILWINGDKIPDTTSLPTASEAEVTLEIRVSRNQRERLIRLTPQPLQLVRP